MISKHTNRFQCNSMKNLNDSLYSGLLNPLYTNFVKKSMTLALIPVIMTSSGSTALKTSIKSSKAVYSSIPSCNANNRNKPLLVSKAHLQHIKCTLEGATTHYNMCRRVNFWSLLSLMMECEEFFKLVTVNLV